MLEPITAECETDFWQTFNPLYSIGIDAYKNEGGVDNDEKASMSIGDDDEIRGPMRWEMGVMRRRRWRWRWRWRRRRRRRRCMRTRMRLNIERRS